MLLMPLMRMTPPFWMLGLRGQIAVRPRVQFADRREVAGRRASVNIE